jgi:hypothetical protein
MTTTTIDSTSHTERLLALMTKGDDLFNARDWDALEAVYHRTGRGRPRHRRRRPDLRTRRARRRDAGARPDVPRHPRPHPVSDPVRKRRLDHRDHQRHRHFTGQMTLPDGTVIARTGKAFDVEFAQTSKWEGDGLIVISAFWDAALQAKQLGLA